MRLAASLAGMVRMVSRNDVLSVTYIYDFQYPDSFDVMGEHHFVALLNDLDSEFKHFQ